MPTDLEDAWNELHDADAARLVRGPAIFDEGRKVWEQHAFDPKERAKAGHRSREWTAIAPNELDAVRELLRCLRLIREGRVPQ